MGNNLRFESRFPLQFARLWKVWRACLLWRKCAHEPLDSCGCERAFHINPLVCTGGTATSVGAVGKRGSVIETRSWFSKTPDLHNLDLDNRAGSQPQPEEALRIDFHFSSVNYGYYCLLFNSLSSFTPPSRYESRRLLPGGHRLRSARLTSRRARGESSVARSGHEAGSR